MLKHKKIFFLLAVFFLIAFFVESRIISFQGNLIEKIYIKEEGFLVEKVYSKDKASLGLGERKNLCRNCGMLFVFPSGGEHVFWMKGMKFPLDIFWIKGDLVVWVEKNVSPDSKSLMGRGVVADHVLELKAGTAERLGISLGDKVIF